MDYECLSKLASRLAGGDESMLGVLSTGERIYVCMAANKPQHLEGNLAYSIGRLGAVDVAELVQRHQCD